MSKQLEILAETERRGHEQIVFFNYPEVGLKAIVAIHNTVLGPALGGCRMRAYASESQAIDDALRLSEGMTYKSSLAGLDLGGGKSCIIADPAMDKGRKELFLKFAECLNHLSGRYITAEDMGTSVRDVMWMREVTKFAAGFAPEEGGGGDPSPWTARGTFRGLLAATERRYGSKDLAGKKVAVQGVGHVGMYLVKYLTEAGAVVTVSDTNKALAEEAKSKYGVSIVEPDKIYDVDCDIYSPCAVGQTVNHDTIKRLSCAVIAGAANNQLQDSSLYEPLMERKVVYCPDFAINSGGIICVAGEYASGGWKESWVSQKVDNVYNTIHKILEEAEKTGRFPEVIALELAKQRIKDKSRAR